MRSGTMAFLSGILALQQLSSLPSLTWLWSLPLLLLCLFVKQHLIRLLCFAAVGFLWTLLYAHHILDQQLPPELEGKDVQVSGHIASLPVRRDRLWRFEFDVEALKYKDKSYPSPGRVRLNWYDHVATPEVGQAWQFTVRLKQPDRKSVV